MKPTIEMQMQASLSSSALLLRQLNVSMEKMFWHTVNIPGFFSFPVGHPRTMVT